MKRMKKKKKYLPHRHFVGLANVNRRVYSYSMCSVLCNTLETLFSVFQSPLPPPKLPPASHNPLHHQPWCLICSNSAARTLGPGIEMTKVRTSSYSARITGRSIFIRRGARGRPGFEAHDSWTTDGTIGNLAPRNDSLVRFMADFTNSFGTHLTGGI